MPGIHVKFDVTPETFLTHLTEAAYEVVLKHGLKASFDVVELDLLEALRGVIGNDMQASHACGSGSCLKAERFDLWSPEAEKIFEEEN